MGIKSNRKSESYFNFFGQSFVPESQLPIVKITASGGTEATPGDGYKYHFWTSSGALTLTEGNDYIEYIAIGGGGGGGGHAGGAGGGGGGARCNIPSLPPITASPVYLCNTPLHVKVGSAGTGGGTGYTPAPAGGNDGGNSEIFPGSEPYPSTGRIRADGGGHGGGGNPGSSPVDRKAQPGGNGGGGQAFGEPTGGGVVSDPNFPAPQGQPGGNCPTNMYGAGGGGLGGEGGDSSGSAGGQGGTGVAFPTVIVPGSYGTPGPAPTWRYFGGGGGGGCHTPGTAGEGGAGGGGDGAPCGGEGTTGSSGTGGGGGGDGGIQGSAADDGRNGGSGFIMIRYQV